MRAAASAGATLFGAAWELRRDAYARGWLRPRAVASRVVSVGNLTTGGTGKTTLALHLMRIARARGVRAAIVARNYHPGPAGRGDEALLYAAALGEEGVFVGRRKPALAAAAAARGYPLILVDDGFSSWGLERDLDLVLLDSQDPWGGGRLLPAGRMREPRRALQRAGAVIVTRLAPGGDPAPLLEEVGRFAPAALLGAGRHRVIGARRLAGGALAPGARVWVVTATGNPAAVERSAREAGFDVAGRSAYRDHHWFGGGELERERGRAEGRGAVLLLTAKDAVRWPAAVPAGDAACLDVEWEWVHGGERIEGLVFGGRAT